MKPMRNVRRPSRRKSQNQPGFPSVPLILRMPAASSAEIILAMFRVDQKAARRIPSSLVL